LDWVLILTPESGSRADHHGWLSAAGEDVIAGGSGIAPVVMVPEGASEAGP
jgi:hypothetical protein